MAASHPRRRARTIAATCALLFVACAVVGDAAAQGGTPGCPANSPAEQATQCFIIVGLGGENGVANLRVDSFTPQSPVKIEIYASKAGFEAGDAPHFGPLTLPTDGTGSTGTGPLLGGAPITPGNYAVVTDEATGTVKTHEVSPHTILTVDEESDTVSGTGRPGDLIDVTLGSPIVGGQIVAFAGKQVFVDPDGSWTADFRTCSPGSPCGGGLTEPADITPQTSAGATFRDTDGDVTRVPEPLRCPPRKSFLPDCVVGADLELDQVNGVAVTPNSEVSFQVFAANGQPVFGPLSATTDSVGATELVLLGFDYGVDLVPGQRVVMTDLATSTVKVLDLIPLSIDSVDPVANVVAGRAPPGSTVGLGGGRPLGGSAPAMILGADSECSPPDPVLRCWTADFAAVGYDVTDQDGFSISVSDDDQDFTADGLGAPIPGCVPDEQTVCGTAGPDTIRPGEDATPARVVTASGGPSPADQAPRTAFAGAGDDIVLVTVTRSTQQTIVDTGTGSVERIVVSPGAKPPRRPPADGPVQPHVIVRGSQGSMLVVLPAHAGNLVLKVVGGSGSDSISTRDFGGTGSSRGGYRISGKDGNDALVSGDGADRINGGNGNDGLGGGRGADRLDGGLGSDVISGGRGRDTCIRDEGDIVKGCEVVRRN